MPILGAHMSIAGGYYRAVELAHQAGCDCVQLFTKNNNQWRAKAISDDDAARFKSALQRLKIGYPQSHDSYLINLASPDGELWEKSIEAFRVELTRAEQLAVPWVVMHPGAHTTSTQQEGIARVAAALDRVHRETPGLRAITLLENTAGQGSTLGWRFEQLEAILDRVAEPERLGVCIDTCHTFAAGYPLDTKEQYDAMVGELAATVGLERVRSFHLNDSKQPLGSRVDRHEHIGRGHLGLRPFWHLLNDARFADRPMYLETPKETIDEEDMDVVNLRTLRALAGGRMPPSA